MGQTPCAGRGRSRRGLPHAACLPATLVSRGILLSPHASASSPCPAAAQPAGDGGTSVAVGATMIFMYILATCGGHQHILPCPPACRQAGSMLVLSPGREGCRCAGHNVVSKAAHCCCASGHEPLYRDVAHLLAVNQSKHDHSSAEPANTALLHQLHEKDATCTVRPQTCAQTAMKVNQSNWALAGQTVVPCWRSSQRRTAAYAQVYQPLYSCQTHLYPSLLNLVTPCEAHTQAVTPASHGAPMLPRVPKNQGPNLKEVAAVGPQGCRLRGHHSCAR